MTAYTRCRVCGRYTPITALQKGGICSEDCALTFESCLNCGRYFARGSGAEQSFCSKECTTRYKINRKYGPEPITFFTEELV